MARYTPPGSLNSILAINAELEKISEAFKDTVSRKNDSPNQMEGDLDLNGNSLLNLKSDPNNPDSVLLKKDVYTKEETDDLLEENRGYTDVREANIRADFTEGITGATVVVYPNIASLEASEPTQTGQRAEVIETGGQYITADVSYTPIAGDYTAGNGRIWQLVGGYVKTDLTVGIPSDFDTLQDAVDYYHGKITFSNRARLNINIQTGNALTSGLVCKGGDYSYIDITSDDATVTLSAAFSAAQIDADITGIGTNNAVFAVLKGANGPYIDVLVDANLKIGSGHGVFIGNTSQGQVGSGKGVINAEYHGFLVLNNSGMDAGAAKFSGSNWGCRVTTNSNADVRLADVSGCRMSTYSGVGTTACLDVSRGSIVNFKGAGGLANNGAARGIAARRSRVSAEEVDVSNSGTEGVRAENASTVSFSQGIADGCGTAGVSALTCSTIDAALSVLTNSGGNGALADDGSNINARGANCEGYTSRGFFANSGSRINCRDVRAQKDGATDAATDIVTFTGSTINAAGATGGLVQTANTVSSLGIIFQ